MKGIDIASMRKGKQLNSKQRDLLIAPVTDSEIFTSLKGISDLSAPGTDGYSAKFYKASWEAIKHMGVHGLGKPNKPNQTHPNRSKKVGWVGLLGEYSF